MNAWVSEYTGVSRDKLMKGSQEMMKKTADEIVRRYEGRITTVRESEMWATLVILASLRVVVLVLNSRKILLK